MRMASSASSKTDGAEDRAEDLIAGDAHVGRDIGEDGGLDEEAVGLFAIGIALAAADDAGAFLLADFDEVQDAVHLAGGDLRADLGVGIERVAEAQFAGARGQFLQEAIVNILVEQEARGGGTHFALVAEDAPERGAHGGVEIGVGEDDVGRFAAQFQAQALEVADGRILQQLARGGDAAGEADLVHVLMEGEELRRWWGRSR